MIRLSDIKKVYFIGVGGIGMSAIARFFLSRGIAVCGYDKTPTALTHQLADEGVNIHYTDDVNLAPKDVDLVVYTPAIPKDHSELNFFMRNGYQVMKRSDVLQIITDSCKNVCVAGTHGKTTISTMTAHLLRHSGVGCNAFLGGIAVNYGTNFWSSPNNICVVEADEFDRSFLKLSPDVAIVTSMDPDHLDIYGTAEAMEEAFIAFTQRIRPEGLLIYHHDLPRGGAFAATQKYTYSLNNPAADIHALNLSLEKGSYCFDVKLLGATIEGMQLNVGGLHNVENVLAAVAAAHFLGVTPENIKAAVKAYRGVKRRFEYILAPGEAGTVIIDDYAHHPAELNALIEGARNLFPHHRMTVVFQPHLYSRTQNLYREFAESLDKADEVILLPIYPARELPIEGVSSEMIYQQMQLSQKHLMTREELLQWSKEHKPELLITAGAGDIDRLIDELKNNLMN